MIVKKVVSLLLILLLTFGATSLALAKDSLTIATSAEAKRFFASGPDGSNNNDYVVVLNNLYDTLVVLSPQGELEPALATHWEVSEDGKCYTFTIREGVKFHDGSIMTAEDVAFSLNVSSQIANGKALLINFDYAEAVDENTVKVYLTDPYAGRNATLPK